MQRIIWGIETIKNTYLKLAEANMDYYRNFDDVESFRNLIGQRAMLIEDTDVIIEELRSVFSKKYQNIAFENKSLIELLFAVVDFEPEFADSIKEVSNVLRELVETDKLVEKKIDSLKDDIKVELGKVRQTSKSLKGYKQLETYGSCFINKVK